MTVCAGLPLVDPLDLAFAEFGLERLVKVDLSAFAQFFRGLLLAGALDFLELGLDLEALLVRCRLLGVDGGVDGPSARSRASSWNCACCSASTWRFADAAPAFASALALSRPSIRFRTSAAAATSISVRILASRSAAADFRSARASRWLRNSGLEGGGCGLGRDLGGVRVLDAAG
jgi:hypothetical protein